MGKLRCAIPQENDKGFIVTLDNVKFVPEMWINLFSIGKALKKGLNLRDHGETIKLTKESVTLKFDEVVRTKIGFVPGIRMTPVMKEHGMIVIESKRLNLIDINNLHKILGHFGEVSTRVTGNALGHEVTGKFDSCEACSVGNAKQKTRTRR
jgi:hypothetical protein